MIKPRPFSQALWSEIEATYAAILEHPFIAGLTDGTLKRDAFRFYVVQDAHYLHEYARAFSVAAARAPSEPDIAMFAQHAAGAIKVERSLHESFFRDFGLSDEEVAATPVAPTNLAYTSYLLAVAYGGSFPEALEALLPCYWIYWEVGKERSPGARPIRSTGAGSRPTAATSSPPSSAPSSRSPTASAPSSTQASASGSPSAS
ncbi:MAG: TenA family protein [Solirubrobacteraceae bacterium]